MFCPITKENCKEHECEWFMVNDEDTEACAAVMLVLELNKKGGTIGD